MPNWEQIARNAANAHGLDPDLFANQIRAESNFNPNSTSSAGAQGIAQIMPATARGWGVDPHDPRASLNAAAKNMAHYVNNYGGWKNALIAYNAGPSRVGKPMYKETRDYVNRILGGTNPKGNPSQARTAPQTVATSSVSAANDPKTQILEFIMKGSAFEGEATKRYKPTPTAGPMRPPVAAGSGGPVPGQRKGEPGWAYLQRMGTSMFGLRNDAGTTQTYGGRHSAGSEHGWDKANPERDGRAIDFGTAKNTPAQLAAWLKWAKSQGFDAINEGDHIHVSMPGGRI